MYEGIWDNLWLEIYGSTFEGDVDGRTLGEYDDFSDFFVVGNLLVEYVVLSIGSKIWDDKWGERGIYIIFLCLKKSSKTRW